MDQGFVKMDSTVTLTFVAFQETSLQYICWQAIDIYPAKTATLKRVTNTVRVDISEADDKKTYYRKMNVSCQPASAI